MIFYGDGDREDNSSDLFSQATNRETFLLWIWVVLKKLCPQSMNLYFDS